VIQRLFKQFWQTKEDKKNIYVSISVKGSVESPVEFAKKKKRKPKSDSTEI